MPLLKAQLAIIGLIVVCGGFFPVDSKSVINMQQFSSICCLQHANVTILYNPIIKSQGRSVWLDLRLAFFIVCIKKKKTPLFTFSKSYFYAPAFKKQNLQLPSHFNTFPPLRLFSYLYRAITVHLKNIYQSSYTIK